MKSNPWRGLVPLLLACLVAGCGGAGSESASTNTNSAISALSAPANFDFATFRTHAVTANGLLNAVGGVHDRRCGQSLCEGLVREFVRPTQSIGIHVAGGIARTGLRGHLGSGACGYPFLVF